MGGRLVHLSGGEGSIAVSGPSSGQIIFWAFLTSLAANIAFYYLWSVKE